jgi:hypothetical protein
VAVPSAQPVFGLPVASLETPSRTGRATVTDSNHGVDTSNPRSILAESSQRWFAEDQALTRSTAEAEERHREELRRIEEEKVKVAREKARIDHIIDMAKHINATEGISVLAAMEKAKESLEQSEQ